MFVSSDSLIHWFTRRADCYDPQKENWEVNMPRHGTPESGGDFRQITAANIVFFSFLDKSAA